MHKNNTQNMDVPPTHTYAHPLSHSGMHEASLLLSAGRVFRAFPPLPLPPCAQMDFRNEALNAQRMAALLEASDFAAARQLVIPQPLMELSTRRVLTMEWVTGVKLTTLQVRC